MELACPRCGALNREDAVDFPFCHQCHEPLVKCGYCRYFDPGQVVCEHPRVVQRQVAFETIPTCEFYTPTALRRWPSLRGRAVPAPWWIAGLICLLAVLLVIVLKVIPRMGPGIFEDTLELKSKWPAAPNTDGTLPITITIINPRSSRDATGPLLVRMPRVFYDDMRLAVDSDHSVDPKPLRHQTAGKSVLLRFPSVNPGATLTVTFHARPRDKARGSYQCVVQAGARNFPPIDLVKPGPVEGSR